MALPEWSLKATNEMRVIGDTLLRISRKLHEQTHKLEVAVEGKYASDGGEPRVRLLSESLNMSRIADLELGRLNQAMQRLLLTVQGQANGDAQAASRVIFDR